MRRATKFAEGGYIPLDWPDSEPPVYYVRGWVDKLEALYTVSEIEGDYDYTEPLNRLVVQAQSTALRPAVESVINHCYARWAMVGRDDFGSGTCQLWQYQRPGRGRFKVTAIHMEVDAAELIKALKISDGESDEADLLP